MRLCAKSRDPEKSSQFDGKSLRNPEIPQKSRRNHLISQQDICHTVCMAKLKAKESIQKLGVEALDIENNKHVIEAMIMKIRKWAIAFNHNMVEVNQTVVIKLKTFCVIQKNLLAVKDVCIEDPSEIQSTLKLWPTHRSSKTTAF